MIAALWGLASSASTVNVTLCAVVDVDYSDTSVGDRWTDGSDRPARGFHAKVYDHTSSTWVWPDATGDWAALEDGDSMTGCTTSFVATSGHTFDLYVRSSAEVDGHTVNAYDGDVSPTYAQALPIYDYPISASSVIYGSPLNGSTEPRWNHLALAAFAIKSWDGTTVADTYNLYEDNGSCGFANVNGAHFHANCGKRKFVVAHELGHVVTLKSDPGGGTDDPAGLPEDCDGGYALRKRYAKNAFTEGVADFYSALVWNVAALNADCDWAYNALDFDLSGGTDTLAADPVACVGDPIDSLSPDPGDRDWLRQLVLETDVAPDCDGELDNRLTNYDFTRYAWSIITIEQVPIVDFWQVWDAADVRTSDGDDNGVGSLGSTSTADDTLVRWEQAMDDNGYLTEHQAQADHGLVHDP
ncbi:MAG: hypothetical protein ABMA64_01215 [Myxococcota bacterium]